MNMPKNLLAIIVNILSEYKTLKIVNHYAYDNLAELIIRSLNGKELTITIKYSLSEKDVKEMDRLTFKDVEKQWEDKK